MIAAIYKKESVRGRIKIKFISNLYPVFKFDSSVSMRQKIQSLIMIDFAMISVVTRHGMEGFII